jgi:hypothetical protein
LWKNLWREYIAQQHVMHDVYANRRDTRLLVNDTGSYRQVNAQLYWKKGGGWMCLRAAFGSAAALETEAYADKIVAVTLFIYHTQYRQAMKKAARRRLLPSAKRYQPIRTRTVP